MNNKAFTLTELLAVIILLTLLTSIVVFSVGSVLNTSKENLTKTQISNIEKAAETYYLREGIDDTDYNLDETEDCVNLSYLIENGYIDDDEIENFVNNNKLDGSVEINYNSNQYTYKYKENKCVIVTPICKYQNNGVSEKTAGAKYTCEVKEGTSYTFYVLTTPEEKSKTINLIMDRNICEDGSLTEDGKLCLVAYKSSGDTQGFGPVTAMTYLNNATSSWKNIDNLNLKYDDEDGSFKGFVINGKARLPYKSEVSAYDSTNKTNAYLYNYLEQSGTIQENVITGITGYWTLSSYSGYSSLAWSVHYIGRLNYSNALKDEGRGVRPVITLQKKYVK